MRILWLIDSLTLGGAERLAATFARQSKAAGIDLEIVSLTSIGGNPIAAEIEAAGVPVRVLGASSLTDFGAFRALLRHLRRARPDVIHAHLSYAEIWGRLAAALTRIPFVSTAHVSRFANPSGQRARDRFIEVIVKVLRLRVGGPTIAVSQALRDRLTESGLPEARIAVVRNGIETARISSHRNSECSQVRTEFGIPADAPLILSLAVMRKGKGHALLVEAAARVLEAQPDAHFLLAGGGPLEGEIRHLVDAMRLSNRVHLAGQRSDVPALLAAADLFVQPSPDFDALPTVVMEAMAARLPVVAIASGGVAEIVCDGETGLVVHDARPAAFASGILAVLADPAKAKSMGEAGFERVVAEFDARVWARRLRTFYRQTGEPDHAPSSQARPLRVMVVEFLGRGGLLHYAHQMCEALAGEGVQAKLVTDRNYELADLDRSFAVRTIFDLWDPRPVSTDWSKSPSGRMTRFARRALRATRYYVAWWRLILLVRRERPDVVQFGEIRFATDLLPLLVLKAMRIRLADVCHNVSSFDIGADSEKVLKESKWHRAALRRIYSCFDWIFVHTEGSRAELSATYGVRGDRIHHIPHGNEDLFLPSVSRAADGALAKLLRMDGSAPTALFFGTLTKYKGLPYLLEAFAVVRARMPEARLVIAGFPNPDAGVDALLERAARRDLAGAVRFHLNYVEVADVAGLFAAADIAVFPYLMIYQSGALQVAYSFAVPVVATNVGGLADAVADGKTGLLVPPRDPAALADALVTLLGDRTRARAMGEAGRAASRQEHSWQEIARKLRTAYEMTPGKPHAPPCKVAGPSCP